MICDKGEPPEIFIGGFGKVNSSRGCGNSRCGGGSIRIFIEMRSGCKIQNDIHLLAICLEQHCKQRNTFLCLIQIYSVLTSWAHGICQLNNCTSNHCLLRWL